MKVGDVVYVTNLAARLPVTKGHGGLSEVGYAARNPAEPRKKGETPVFALLVLGLDTLERPSVDPDEVLKSLGWTPPPDEPGGGE